MQQVPETNNAENEQPKPPLPAPTFSEEQYGPHERNVFDFWQASPNEPTPLIVFMHGGGFRGGSKDMITATAIEESLDAGASIMSINYRFLAHVPLPDILRDCGRAIQYVRHNAQKFNIDPSRIAACGASAGAGAALWLAAHDDLADPNSADQVLRQSTRLSAVGLYNTQSTYDFGQWSEIVYPFTEEFRSHPSELLDFYHFKNEEEFNSEAGRKIRAECSMVDLIAKDTPPIYLLCPLPDGDPIDRGHMLHHPKHVYIIKNKCDEVGVEAETHREPCEDALIPIVRFLLKQLSKEEEKQ